MKEVDDFMTECRRMGWGWSLGYDPEDSQAYTASIHMSGTTVVSHDAVLTHAIARSLFVATNAQREG